MNYNIYSKILQITCLSFTIISTINCSKFIDVKAPINSLNEENVYNSDATAIAVLTGIYTNFSSEFRSGSLSSTSLITGLSADELNLFDGTASPASEYIPYYINALTDQTTGSIDLSKNIYNTLYISNSAIEGLTNSNHLTVGIKNQLLGEAKFIRGLCYFYLVNLYGAVPLALSTDYKVNAYLPKSSVENVYKQIISDLKESKNLLNKEYLGANLTSTTEDRIRPTYWAATALLARVFLYTKDYTNAEVESSEVINNKDKYDTVSINNVFISNNREAIWQLQPVGFTAGGIPRTQEASIFMLPADGFFSFNEHPVYLSESVIDSFETGDNRKEEWTGSTLVNGVKYYYAAKYKSYLANDPENEFSTVFRLAEQYLIRSESRLELGKINESIDDLNIIRLRAGLSNTKATTASELRKAIIHERQVELFTEWGHRWFDLKRTGNVNNIMVVVTAAKGGEWNLNWQYYPFNLTDLKRDPNLVQNDGY